MAFSTTAGYPDVFVIGDAYSFTITDADHPATGGAWTSKILFKNADTGVVVSFDGVASGADHLFALTNANTLTIAQGNTLVCIVFSDGTHRQSTDWIEKVVLPDPTTPTVQSTAQKIVASLTAAIQSASGRTTGSVSVDGITYTWTSLKTLNDMLVQWQAAVFNERRARDAARGIDRTRIHTRFARC